MDERSERPNETSRRDLLRRGKKLAYVAPAVIAAMKVESAFALSSGGTGDTTGGTGGDTTGGVLNTLGGIVGGVVNTAGGLPK